MDINNILKESEGEEIDQIKEEDNWPLKAPPSEEDAIYDLMMQLKNENKQQEQTELNAPDSIKLELAEIIENTWCTNKIPEKWEGSVQFPIAKINRIIESSLNEVTCIK